MAAREFLLPFEGKMGVDLTHMDQPSIKALIVDDEPVARRVLREGLGLFPDVLVIGEAENGKEALQKIEKLAPDLVFLDLQMPVMSGFELVRALGDDPSPVIIIVTAFDQHAIQAFEAGAVDYLLKPVSETRLEKAVERARALVRRPIDIANQLARLAAINPAGASAKSRKVVGRSGADYVLLDADDVLAFQAERELVWIITARQRLLATQSLRAIEERLPAPEFRRVHRNAIVNVNHVRKMSALSSQRWLITLSNGLQLIVSKRQAHSIRQILNW
ncbi:MAG TPA: LytTR family DNA-binding domain-containing protein [Bryobacteraceae bacterium]|nr:LytTR family DNA-binding domain-containing protein [Bryobacteraceae bacterium]